MSLNRPRRARSLAQIRRLIKSSSVTRVIDLLGDKAVLRVLEEVLAGAHRFDELQARIGMSRNTLAKRLAELVDHHILVRMPYQERPTRFEYHLSERGQDLSDLILHIDTWERRWSGDLAGTPLMHSACGHQLRVGLSCAHCQQAVDPRDMDFLEGSASGRGVARRVHQRRARGLHTADDGTSMSAADLIGDWWTALVLSLALFGVRRFNEMQETVGIAPNILSSRLAHLTACGVLSRLPYQDSPPRFEYRLTAKGMELYPAIVAMMRWGDRWLSPRGFVSLILQHKPCGAQLVPATVCLHCGEAVNLADVHTPQGRSWVSLPPSWPA